MARPNKQQRPMGMAWLSLMLVAVESFQRSYPGPTLPLASSRPGFRSCSKPIPPSSLRIQPPSGVPWTLSSPSHLLWGTKSDDDKSLQQKSDTNRDELRNESSERKFDPSFLPDEFDRQQSQMWEMGSVRERNHDEEAMAQLLELGGDPSFLQSAAPTNTRLDSPVRHPNPPPKIAWGTAEAEELEALGGDPFFLNVDDELTEDQLEEDQYPGDKRDILSSDDFASNPTSFTSRLQATMIETATLDSDDDDRESSLEELEAMGGDPFFLGPIKEATGGNIAPLVGGPRQQQLNMREAIGPSFQEMPPQSKGPYYTALEGETFASSAEEVESLGGDPFFSGSEHDDDNLELAPQIERALSPESPSTVGPPSGMESFRSKVKERKISKASPDKEELLEMGGDPSFLATYDRSDESGGYESEYEKNRVEELAGDPFFL